MKPHNESREYLKSEIEKVIGEVNCTTTMEDVDKFHRNGRELSGEQDVIVRFKSHYAKEVFYKNRKNRVDVVNRNRNIKIQPSLTKQNSILLAQARKVLEEDYTENYDVYLHNPPDFVLANVHGVVQVKMKEKNHKDEHFFEFNSITDLHNIIKRCNSRQNRNEVADYDAYMLRDDQPNIQDPTAVVPAPVD